MTNKLVRIEKLSLRLGNRLILDSLDLELAQQEFVSVLGPSGCGKTTLLRIISGLQDKTSGKIEFHFVRRQAVQVGVAFQRTVLFPWLTLAENIRISMNNGNMANRDQRTLVKEYLKRAHLERFAGYYPHQVSGGMQQKVNVLRCFCCGSDLILMDEPFVFLDFLQRLDLQRFTLDIWQKEKKTVLFVTHNINEAIALSDRILLMAGDPGRVIKEFKVALPRPRDPGAIREDPEYIGLFKEINAQLDREIRMSLERTEAGTT